MPHRHTVIDDDHKFVVDPTTRAVTNKAGSRTTIMQFDHQSEELYFEVPRVIEGHDMTLCDVVQVHFTNIGTGTSVSNRQSNPGVYEMTNLRASDEDPNILVCSWLISQAATQYYGKIEFALQFICYDSVDPEVMGYIWNTDICDTIDVKKSISNHDAILENYPDLYYQLEERVSDLETSGIADADLELALKDYLSENDIFSIDATLTQTGEAADAGAVGRKFTELEREIENAGSKITVDTTLSINGAAADAEVVGKHITRLDKAIENLVPGSGGGTVDIDDTLSRAGAAADAKAVGDELEALRDEIANFEPELPSMPYSYGTEDLTAGVSPLESGKLYFVYE